jgi:hypothetical protein
MSMVEHINLKEDMPSVDEAGRRLAQILKSSRSRAVKALKIIHGYGSQGVGGAIRASVRKSLMKRVRAKEIRACIPGETWSLLNKESQEVLRQCDALSGDPDLGMANPGITVVLM